MLKKINELLTEEAESEATSGPPAAGWRPEHWDPQPKEWELKIGGEARVDPTNGMAVVPGGADRASWILRQHESQHLLSSGLSIAERTGTMKKWLHGMGVEGVEYLTHSDVEVLEEVRVNKLLTKRLKVRAAWATPTDYPFEEVLKSLGETWKATKNGPARRNLADVVGDPVVGMTAWGLDFGQYTTDLRDCFSRAELILLDRAAEASRRRSVRDTAKALIDMRKTPQRAQRRTHRAPSKFGNDTTEAQRDLADHGTVPKAERGSGKWGSMHIVEGPRSAPCQPNFTEAVDWLRTEKIGAPMYLPRFRRGADRAIFGRRRPTAGPLCLLIDVSGSMSWDRSELTKLLQDMPESTLAVYSGRNAWGQLHIVAKDGMRLSDYDIEDLPHHGGNVVDGPALEWLGEQHGTKVWLSDGGVTGCGDASVTMLRAKAKRLCDQHNITLIHPTDFKRMMRESTS